MQLASEYQSDKTPDITKTASKDKTRPVLTAVHLDTERAVLESTDSYCLAAIPVTIEDGDVSGLIPAEAITAMQKAQRAHRYTTLSMKCEEGTVTLETPDGSSSWIRPVGQFPNVPQLTPAPEDLSGFVVRLNAAFLAKTAAAIGTEVVTLRFVRDRGKTEGEDTGYYPANLRPIVVSNGGHGESALVMPVRPEGR